MSMGTIRDGGVRVPEWQHEMSFLFPLSLSSAITKSNSFRHDSTCCSGKDPCPPSPLKTPTSDMHQAINQTQFASMPEGDLAASGLPNPLASRELVQRE